MSYLTVKQFALQAGVSPQAIYQRLDKYLKQYSSTQNGKKVLDTSALQLFGFKDFKESINQENSSNSSDLTLNALLKQIEIKDRQIEALTEALQTEQKLHIEARQQLRLLQAAQQPEPETAPEQPPAANQVTQEEQKKNQTAAGHPESESTTAEADQSQGAQSRPESKHRTFRELWHDFWNG